MLPELTNGEDTGDHRITLRTPIRDGDRVITELTFTEPAVGDLMALDEYPGDFAKSIATIAVMTGLPMAACKQIRASDMLRIAPVIEKVMGRIPTTGESSQRGSPGASTSNRVN
jgi:hypothetical protein